VDVCGSATLRADWSDRPLLGLIVNGARATTTRRTPATSRSVTGRVRSDGRIGNWLVDNFYTLDAESEKGIVAAPVPLDAYLGDLNSGQSWYRPSYLLSWSCAMRARRRSCNPRSAASTTSSIVTSSPTTPRCQLHKHQRRCAARARMADPRRGPTWRWLGCSPFR
jgi:hypothetical protein